MPKKLTIKIVLSENRDDTGRLELLDETGSRLAGPFPAYGRSDTKTATKHGNPSRVRTKLFGDTPQGDYRVPETVLTGGSTGYPDRSYGPNGALRLDPAGGEALTAKLNGRTGLLIHGGAPGKQGRLRATHGCIRLSNEDIKKLLKAIRDAADDPSKRMCLISEIAASIGPPGDPESGEDVGDPPRPMPDIGKP